MNPFDTLIGGRKVEVTRRDGSQETVTVLQLPVRRFPEYLQAQDNEARMVELLTGKPPDWVDGLSEESHVAILTAGDEVNRDFFFSWQKRTRDRLQRLAATVAPGPNAPSPTG